MFIKKKLSNGVTLIAEKLPKFHSVTCGIWVGAGSITETGEENGISHLIEHMLFKGTEKRSAKEIAIAVDNIGGQINAFTSKESTCYYIKMINEKVEQGIEILADLFCNSVLDEGELEKEKSVVLEEIAMSNDNPEDVAMDLISSTFFNGCSLQKTILGPPKNIKSFEREDLKSYINRYYSTENIVVAVAGGFEEKQLIECLEEHLGGMAPFGSSIPGFADCGDFSYAKGFAVVEKDIEQVHVCMGLPSYSVKQEKRYALSVLNNVIGGSMSSRLFQRIREEMGMAYAVFSHPVLYRDTGMYSLYAGTMAQNAATVTEMILEELDRVKKDGITQEEFLQSKEQLKGSLMLSLESTSAKMNAIGKSMILTGRVYSDDELLHFINKVTYEDVRGVIDEVIKPENLTATFVGKVEDEGALKGIVTKEA